MNVKVQIARGEEEWDALYIDGRLVHEDHSLDAHAVLRELERAGAITITAEVTIKSTVLEDRGRHRGRFADIEPREILE